MHVIFPDNFLRVLSWTFIHSLWQGLILTFAAGLIMLITKKSVASLRYILLCTLFFLFLGGVAFTFLVEWYAGPGNSSALKLMTNSNGIGAIFHHSVFRQPIEKFYLYLDSNSQWLILGWLIILGFKSSKIVLDMIYVSRLRTHKISAPGNEWKIKLQSLSYEMGIRKKITLLQSALVRVPIIVGHFKPVILVPIGILTGLRAVEVEAVLLHELAHIRRHDYFVNFIQRIVETLFFFNPALLWVSSLIRIERENCCDDLAIAKTKDKVQFVGALISFKEHSLRHSTYALGLFGKRNLLLQRVSRIVRNRNKTLSPLESVFFIMSFFVLVLLVSVATKQQNTKPLAALPGALNIEPSLFFSAKPIMEIQALPNKKPISTTKQGLTVFSSNKSAKRTVETKGHDLIERDRQLAQLDYQHLQLSRLQADKDRAQTEKNRQQVEKDRIRADNDREQAERDRKQAEKDRIQAGKDREQASLDRQRAGKDREKAEKAATRSIKI